MSKDAPLHPRRERCVLFRQVMLHKCDVRQIWADVALVDWRSKPCNTRTEKEFTKMRRVPFPSFWEVKVGSVLLKRTEGLKSVLRPKLCWFIINLDDTAKQEKTLASHFYAHQHAAYACWASDIHADKHAPCYLGRVCFLPMFSSPLQEKKAFKGHEVCHFSQKCSFRFLHQLPQWETKDPRADFALCFEQCHVMLPLPTPSPLLQKQQS